MLVFAYYYLAILYYSHYHDKDGNLEAFHKLNSCLLTSPSPKLKKLESNLFLHNFYLAACDTQYNKTSGQVMFRAIKLPVI